MRERRSSGSRSVPRITDVAALAQVAPSTASKALNGTGQLRSTTRERVRAAAEQLGFTPDGRGRALSSGRSYTVGLVTTDSSGRFSIPIMIGAEDALSAGQMALLLADTRGDPIREQHYLRTLVARGVDAIIVTGRRTEARPSIDVPVPVVYAFSPSEDPLDASVVVDDRGGAASVIDHLLSIGRTRIAHVTGPERHQSAVARAEGVETTAGERLVVPALFGEWSEKWGRHAVDRLLDSAGTSSAGIDAICCGSDQIARGVIDRLRERDAAVPDTIAVTGFDNWEVMAMATRPPLTTVDMQLEEVGRRSVDLLVRAIDGDPHHGTVALPTRLVVRESTVDV